MISLANEVHKGLQSAIPFFIHTPPADEISWKGKREGRIRKLKSRSVDEIFRDRWGISGTFPKVAIEIFWGSVLGRTNISRQSLGYHGIFGGWVLKKSCGHFDFFLILIGGWWIWNGMTQSCTKPLARYVSIKKYRTDRHEYDDYIIILPRYMRNKRIKGACTSRLPSLKNAHFDQISEY